MIDDSGSSFRGYSVAVAYCGARPVAAAGAPPSDAAVNLAIAEHSGVAIEAVADGEALRGVLRRWGEDSRRRDCHLRHTPVSSVGVSIGIKQGVPSK